MKITVKDTEISIEGNDIHIKCDGNDIHLKCDSSPRWMVNSSHPNAFDQPKRKWQQSENGHWMYLSDNNCTFEYKGNRPRNLYNIGFNKGSKVVHKKLPNNYGTVIKVDGNLVWYQNKHALFVRPSDELELINYE